MIAVSDKSSGVSLGSITESQLQVLVDHLEETSLDDQDYYIDRHTIDMIKTVAVDYATVLDLLQRALGDKDGADIVWSRM